MNNKPSTNSPFSNIPPEARMELDACDISGYLPLPQCFFSEWWGLPILLGCLIIIVVIVLLIIRFRKPRSK